VLWPGRPPTSAGLARAMLYVTRHLSENRPPNTKKDVPKCPCPRTIPDAPAAEWRLEKATAPTPDDGLGPRDLIQGGRPAAGICRQYRVNGGSGLPRTTVHRLR